MSAISVRVAEGDKCLKFILQMSGAKLNSWKRRTGDGG